MSIHEDDWGIITPPEDETPLKSDCDKCTFGEKYERHPVIWCKIGNFFCDKEDWIDEEENACTDYEEH